MPHGTGYFFCAYVYGGATIVAASFFFSAPHSTDYIFALKCMTALDSYCNQYSSVDDGNYTAMENYQGDGNQQAVLKSPQTRNRHGSTIVSSFLPAMARIFIYQRNQEEQRIRAEAAAALLDSSEEASRTIMRNSG